MKHGDKLDLIYNDITYAILLTTKKINKLKLWSKTAQTTLKTLFLFLNDFISLS